MRKRHEANEGASPKVVRLLLVEDNPADAVLIEEILLEEHHAAFLPVKYEIEKTDRLSQALTILAKNPPDAVLLDLHLPDSSGLDTLEHLLKEFPHAAVIVLTGIDDDQVGTKAVQQGAQDYLDKGADLVGDVVGHAIYYAIERNKFNRQMAELQRQLYVNNLAFLSVMERNCDGILIIDQKNTLCFLNEAMAGLLEKRRDELLGMSFRPPQKISGLSPVTLKRANGSLRARVNVCEVFWEGSPAVLLHFCMKGNDESEGESFTLSVDRAALRLV